MNNLYFPRIVLIAIVTVFLLIFLTYSFFVTIIIYSDIADVISGRLKLFQAFKDIAIFILWLLALYILNKLIKVYKQSILQK